MAATRIGLQRGMDEQGNDVRESERSPRQCPDGEGRARQAACARCCRGGRGGPLSTRHRSGRGPELRVQFAPDGAASSLDRPIAPARPQTASRTSAARRDKDPESLICPPAHQGDPLPRRSSAKSFIVSDFDRQSNNAGVVFILTCRYWRSDANRAGTHSMAIAPCPGRRMLRGARHGASPRPGPLKA